MIKQKEESDEIGSQIAIESKHFVKHRFKQNTFMFSVSVFIKVNKQKLQQK